MPKLHLIIALALCALAACSTKTGPATSAHAAPAAPQDAQPAAPTNDADCISATLTHALKEARAAQPEDAAHIDKARLSASTLADLDLDGKPEQLWVDEYSGSANMLHMLYLSNKGCVRFGGHLWVNAESIEVMEERHDGMHKLTTFAKEGCAGLEGQVQLMAWSHDRYKVERTIRCACPDDAPEAPRDQSCP